MPGNYKAAMTQRERRDAKRSKWKAQTGGWGDGPVRPMLRASYRQKLAAAALDRWNVIRGAEHDTGPAPVTSHLTVVGVDRENRTVTVDFGVAPGHSPARRA